MNDKVKIKTPKEVVEEGLNRTKKLEIEGQDAKSLVERTLGVDENGVQITIGKLAPHQGETLAILKMELTKMM